MNMFAFHLLVARHLYIFYEGNLEWILHVEVASYYIFHSTGSHSLTFNCIRAWCMTDSVFDAHFILLSFLFSYIIFLFIHIHYVPCFVCILLLHIYLIPSRNYMKIWKILSRWEYIIIRRDYEFFIQSKKSF